jgi:hypothetical protein
MVRPKQLPLAIPERIIDEPIRRVHRENGQRIRALLVRAIELNCISVTQLERETGYDEKQIGRALKEDGGAHPPLAVVAAILHLDDLGVFVRGMAELAGYEATPARPDHEAENKRLRTALLGLRAELDAVLGAR